jgi:protein-disulfide isomerase
MMRGLGRCSAARFLNAHPERLGTPPPRSAGGKLPRLGDPGATGAGRLRGALAARSRPEAARRVGDATRGWGLPGVAAICLAMALGTAPRAAGAATPGSGATANLCRAVAGAPVGASACRNPRVTGAPAIAGRAASARRAQADTAPKDSAGGGAQSRSGPSAGPGLGDAPMTARQGAAVLRELFVIQHLLQREIALDRGGRAMARRGSAQPHRASLLLSPGWPSLGSPAAPVTMIEFTDLQCPFCRRFERTTYREIAREFVRTGTVRLIALDLPLRMHRFAMAAAVAEQCAAAQGKFWQFRDAVLDDAVAPTPAVLRRHARQLGLDLAAFRRCTAADPAAGRAAIAAGQAAAATAGIRGTPGFLIGRVVGGSLEGTAFAGNRPAAFFDRIIARYADADGSRARR